MPLGNPPVISVLAPPRAFALEVTAGTALELLVALHAVSSPDRGETWAPRADACPPGVRDALEAVGDPTGELWLQLLGFALESPHDDAAAFIGRVRRLGPLALRRQLLGAHAPSWRRAIGPETIESAARGGRRAGDELVARGMRYCPSSARALQPIVSLTGAATKRRVVAALERFAADVLGPQEEWLRAQLTSAADRTRRRAARADPADAIESATGGYRYEHEDMFERVVLFPHLADAPAVLLAEHHDARLIGYAVAANDDDPRAALLAVGRALGDVSRVAILARLRDGEASLGEVADAAGLVKSTAHHHLVQLRAARLITVRGNTQGTFYSLDPTGFARAEHLLGEFTADAAERVLRET